MSQRQNIDNERHTDPLGARAFHHPPITSKDRGISPGREGVCEQRNRVGKGEDAGSSTCVCRKGLGGGMAQGPTPDTPVRLDANPLVPVRFGITGGTVRTPQCLSHLCLCIISAAPPKFRSALTWRAATAAQPSPPPPPPCYVRSVPVRPSYLRSEPSRGWVLQDTKGLLLSISGHSGSVGFQKIESISLSFGDAPRKPSAEGTVGCPGCASWE